MAVPFLLPGTAPPVKRQAPAGCGLPELAMIKYFSAVYAQSEAEGIKIVITDATPDP